MTVKELKDRLQDYSDDAVVLVRNTQVGLVEKAEMPHIQVGERLVPLFEPESLRLKKRPTSSGKGKKKTP